MRYAELAHEIGSLDRARQALERNLAKHVAAEQEALGRSSREFSEHDARECRKAREEVERRLQTATARISALQARLPSPDVLQRAEARASSLAADAEKASTKFRELWCRYTSALDGALAVAGELLQARAEGQKAMAALNNLTAEYGFTLHAPGVPSPERQEAQFAFFAASWLRDVPFGEPNDTVVRDLNAARAALEARRGA